MHRAACVVLCLILACGCAAVQTTGTREYLDSITAATVTVSAEPWVFARERPDLAVNVRDYLSLYAVEVNRSGQRRTYLLVHAWSTVNQSGALPKDRVMLDIAADDRSLSLQPMGAEPRTFGVGDPISPARSAGERTWYYAVDPQALTYVSASRRVSVTLRGDGLHAPYETWRRPSDPLCLHCARP